MREVEITFPEIEQTSYVIEKHELDNLKDGVAGIYVLIKHGMVVYVGQSINMKKRIKCHFREKDFDEIGLIFLSGNVFLNAMERGFINMLQPSLNLVIRKQKRYASPTPPPPDQP